MREHLTLAENRGPEPELPLENHGHNAPDSDPVPDSMATVARITAVMSGSRRLFLFSSGLLTADVAAAAIAMSAFLSHGRGVALGTAGLLAPVMLSWIITATLIIQAEQPVAGALGEIRRATGAPVDLSAPWLALGFAPNADSDIGEEHLVLLIGSAILHYARSRVALLWAVCTSVGLMLWLAIALGIATVF